MINSSGVTFRAPMWVDFGIDNIGAFIFFVSESNAGFGHVNHLVVDRVDS